MLLGLFIALLMLIFLGTPVLLAIGIVSLVGFWITPELMASIFPQKMFAMLDSFSLLAIPYFVLAGEIMSKGGLSEKLVDFAETVVGYLRGGLGHAAVIASMIFANVTGSATAATSAIGSILLPSMKEKGYKPGFSASLMGTAGVIGSIIPPSMVMIVYGSMTGVSIGGLFLAGIIPGIIIVLGLMTTIVLHSYNPKFPELKAKLSSLSFLKIIKAIPKVWVALLAPVIILGGILTGVFTATEAGVVACIYAFLVSFFVYRTISVKDLPKIFMDAAITTTMVVGIIAVAGALGWLLTYLDFNEIVMSAIFSISKEPMIILLMLVGIMMVMAMFVESLAVLVIMIPVIVYIGRVFGFNPYHLGMVIVLATQIGATTPPVAVVLFVATSVAKTTYDETLKYCLPFVVTLILVLIIVFLFPALSSWIPTHFLGGG